MHLYYHRCNNFFIHHSVDKTPCNSDFMLHTHENFELFYFISGKAVFWVEGAEYKLKPGDIMLFNDSESHRIDVSPTEPYERITIHFPKYLFDEIDPDHSLIKPFISRNLGENNLISSDDFDGNFHDICIYNMVKESDTPEVQVISNLLPLLNEVRSAHDRIQTKLEERSDRLSARIVNYINDNLTENITPETICREFFISRSQLYSVFKQTTGAGVWEYIKVKRLMIAKKMLQSGYKPNEVFSKCGFNDYTTFFRAYRKKFGVPPKQDFNRLARVEHVTPNRFSHHSVGDFNKHI